MEPRIIAAGHEIQQTLDIYQEKLTILIIALETIGSNPYNPLTVVQIAQQALDRIKNKS